MLGTSFPGTLYMNDSNDLCFYFSDSIPSNSALNLCKLCMFKTTSRAEMRAHIHGEERESFVHQERSYIFKHFYYLVLKKRDNDMDDGNRSNQVDNEFLKEIELPFSEPDAIMEERPEVCFGLSLTIILLIEYCCCLLCLVNSTLSAMSMAIERSCRRCDFSKLDETSLAIPSPKETL